MQAIHVKRYQSPCGYQGTIEPEDRSWVVFVDDAGKASLWRRVELRDAVLENPELGERISGQAYINVEDEALPEG